MGMYRMKEINETQRNEINRLNSVVKAVNLDLDLTNMMCRKLMDDSILIPYEKNISDSIYNKNDSIYTSYQSHGD